MLGSPLHVSKTHRQKSGDDDDDDDDIQRAVMMRDLFFLFDMFNYYTIFSIVLHLVFFVVIVPVIPKLKNKRLTLLMKISTWCFESYSMLHYILSICMLGICGLDHCSLQTAFTSFIE